MANVKFIPEVKTSGGFDILNTVSTYTNHVATAVSTSTDTYLITVPAPVEVLVEKYILIFVPSSDSITGMKIRVNSGTAIPIYVGANTVTGSLIKSGRATIMLVDFANSKAYSLDGLIESLTGTVSTLSTTVSEINSATMTFTNKRITKRVGSATSTASLAINSDSYDGYKLTAQAAGLTLAAPTGTPTEFQPLIIRIKDNGTARAITWTTGSAGSFRAMGVDLPTTTIVNKTLYIGCIYNATDSRWDVLGIGQED